MGKFVTGLQSSPVTAHEIINITMATMLMMLFNTSMGCAMENDEFDNEAIITDDLQIEDGAEELVSDGHAIINGEAGSYWTFSKKSEARYSATGRAKKVSADYKPGATCNVSTSKTFSAGFSISINSTQKSLIKSSATANVVNSMSSSTSYSLQNDNSKMYAHVLFTPRYDRVKGTLKKRNSMDGSVISSKSVTADYPVKLASKGELDGTYDLEYHAKNKCNR